MTRRDHGKCLVYVLIIVALLGAAVFMFMRHQRAQERREFYRAQIAPPPQSLRIGFISSPSTLPLYPLKRVLSGGDVPVEVHTYSDCDAMWQDLAAGQLDLVFSGVDEFALAIPRLNPGVVFMTYASSGAANAVVGKPPVADVVNIGYQPGTSGYSLASAASNDKSVIGKTTTKLIPVSSQKQLVDMLRRGDIQLAALTQPYVHELTSGGGYQIILNGESSPISQVWVASHQLAEKYKDSYSAQAQWVNAFAREWFSMVAKLYASPARVLKSVAEDGNFTIEAARTALFTGLKFYSPEEALNSAPSIRQELQNYIDDWALSGEYSSPFTKRDYDLAIICNTNNTNLIIAEAQAVPAANQGDPNAPTLAPVTATPAPTAPATDSSPAASPAEPDNGSMPAQQGETPGTSPNAATPGVASPNVASPNTATPSFQPQLDEGSTTDGSYDTYVPPNTETGDQGDIEMGIPPGNDGNRDPFDHGVEVVQ